MRFAVISTLFPPYSRGGAERVAELTARGLLDAGHEVLVITAGPRGSESDEERDGIRVCRFFPPNLFFYGDMGSQPIWKRLMFHLRDAWNEESARIVRDILRKEKPDAVITENIKGLGFRIPRVISELGIRHIHVVHDIQLIEPSGLVCNHAEIPRTPLRSLWSSLMKLLWGSPDVVVCPSKWIADVHRAWGFFPKSRVEIVPNPVVIPPSRHSDPALAGEESHAGSAPKAHSPPANFADAQDDGGRLLFVGQIERHKGVFDLVHAARLVKTEFAIDIIGDGSARAELQRMTAGDPRFVFRGRVDPSRIWELCVRAAATVVPSRCLENAPTTISESLACGTPVVATRVGGIPEMISDGENGWLVPPGDIRALADAMETALKQKNDPDIRDRARKSVEGRTVADYAQKISSLARSPARV